MLHGVICNEWNATERTTIIKHSVLHIDQQNIVRFTIIANEFYASQIDQVPHLDNKAFSISQWFIQNMHQRSIKCSMPQ